MCVYHTKSMQFEKHLHNSDSDEGPVHIRNEPVALGSNNNSVYVYNLYN